MEDAVAYAQKKGAKFAEFSSTDASSNVIETTNKDIKNVTSGGGKVYSMRVVYKKRWGHAYSYKDDFGKLVLKAIENARANQEHSKLKPRKAIKKSVKTPFKINPLNVPLGDKLDILRSIDEYRPEKVKTLKQIYAEKIKRHLLVNSEGSRLKWDEKSIQHITQAFAKDRGRTEQYVDVARGQCGFEIAHDFLDSAKSAMDKAVHLLSARAARGGKANVMIDHRLGGVLVHEAVGHACEADRVLTGTSVLTHKIGKKIGSEIVNVSDDGRVRGFGWTPFDSEGTLASNTVLIEDGILEGFLHTRETASKLKTEPTGNGRVQDLTCRVIPRMTTTIIEAGDSSFDEILQTAKKGYYLKGSLGGQVEVTKGSFLFNAQEGYYFEKGEIRHMVKNVSLIGNILETMHNIRLIARDLKFSDGHCGKMGQAVAVSHGSPHVLIENAMVGGTA